MGGGLGVGLARGVGVGLAVEVGVAVTVAVAVAVGVAVAVVVGVAVAVAVAVAVGVGDGLPQGGISYVFETFDGGTSATGLQKSCVKNPAPLFPCTPATQFSAVVGRNEGLITP